MFGLFKPKINSVDDYFDYQINKALKQFCRQEKVDSNSKIFERFFFNYKNSLEKDSELIVVLSQKIFNHTI